MVTNTAINKSITTSTTLAGNSDANIPTEKAVKAYVDSRPAATAKTIWLPAKTGTPSGAGGCGALAYANMATHQQTFPYFPFDPNTQQYAQWTEVLPNDYSGGTFTAQIYWCASTSIWNDAVIWGIHGISYGDLEAMNSPWGAAAEVTDSPNGTAYNMRVAPTTAPFTLSNTPAAGELANFRVYRAAAQAADTYDQPAYLLGVKLTYY